MSICENIYKKIEVELDNILALREIRTTKKDGSYVTKGDLLSQDIIINYIRSVSDNFEIISEEKLLPEYNPEKNYVVLDPIDGTENFTSGLKEWGVSVSIYKKGQHFESMIAMPELNLRMITRDKIYRYDSRIEGLSSSNPKKQVSSLTERAECRIMGCCVYSFYNVITGSFSEFSNNEGANVWDILAGLNLALEHKLNVVVDGKRYHGEFLSPTKKYTFEIRQK